MTYREAQVDTVGLNTKEQQLSGTGGSGAESLFFVWAETGRRREATCCFLFTDLEVLVREQ